MDSDTLNLNFLESELNHTLANISLVGGELEHTIIAHQVFQIFVNPDDEPNAEDLGEANWVSYTEMKSLDDHRSLVLWRTTGSDHTTTLFAILTKAKNHRGRFTYMVMHPAQLMQLFDKPFGGPNGVTIEDIVSAVSKRTNELHV